MKRRIIAIVAMLCAAAFILSACGGGSAAPKGSGGSAAPQGGGAAAATETFDVGAFTVAVPNGWTAFPQSDSFGEKDAEGNFPVDPESIMLAKGATDEFSAYSAPMVRIYYHGPDSEIMDSRSFYDDVKELEGVTINGTACSAFSGNSIGYVYEFIQYETDTGKYEINILTSADGKDTGITWEDPDVTAILSSLTAK